MFLIKAELTDADLMRNYYPKMRFIKNYGEILNKFDIIQSYKSHNKNFNSILQAITRVFLKLACKRVCFYQQTRN